MKPKAIAIPVPQTAAIPVPNISFGPFVFLDTLPWLLIASLFRVAATRPGGAIFVLLAQLFILMAFISATCRMTEVSLVNTKLARLNIIEQWGVARGLLPTIMKMLVGAAAAGAVLGMGPNAAHLIGGLDGVAFDQQLNIGRLWSVCLGLSIVLIVIENTHGGKTGFDALGAQIAQHWPFLLAAVAVSMLFLIPFSELQAVARAQVVAAYVAKESSEGALIALFFAYVVSFATLRLWVVLAIFCYFLRRSYLNNTAN